MSAICAITHRERRRLAIRRWVTRRGAEVVEDVFEVGVVLLGVGAMKSMTLR
jgi:hypothetical protein